MRVLLLSMPDSFEHTPALTMRMPNGALASLAGNAGPGHQVSVADLILVQDRVVPTVERLMQRATSREVVGLSVMTFQRRTALAARPPDSLHQARRHRRRRRLRSEPGAGGVRSAGQRRRLSRPRRRRADVPRAAARARATAATPRRFPVSPCRRRPRLAPGFRHNPPRAVSRLDDGRSRCRIAPPGCSRLHLPGPPHRHRRDVARLHLRLQLLLDHRDARPQLPHLRLHARARRHRRRAGARRARDLHRRRQHHAERRAVRGALPRDRRRRAQRRPLHRPGDDLVDRQPRRDAGAADAAGGLPLRVPRASRTCSTRTWQFLRASAKNAQREGGRQHRQRDAARHRAAARAPASPSSAASSSATRTTRAASIETNLAFARRYVDWPYIQHPTPYPGTPMTKDFRRRNLIVNERVEEYDGTTAVVRTEHLDGGRNRVPALARGALDEGAAPAVRCCGTTGVRAAPQAGDVRAHVPRKHVAVGARARERARVFARYKRMRASEREYVPAMPSDERPVGHEALTTI